jgi:hypothetical protein
MHIPLRAITLHLLLLMATSIASGAEWKFGHIDPKHPRAEPDIVLTGEIRRGDYDALLTFARRDPALFTARTFVLASQGGDLLEAIRIGQFLRRIYASVFVNPDVGRCLSACFLIYVSSVERDAVVPALGIHRPYFAAREFERLPLAETERRHRQLMQSVKSYLEEQQVPQHLIERMFSMASTETYWLTPSDIASLGRRAHWWDQVLIDRCHLDKELEQEYLNLGRLAPRALSAEAHIRQVAICGFELSDAERTQNLRAALSANSSKRVPNGP